MKAQLYNYTFLLNWENKRISIEFNFLKLNNPLTFITYFGKSPYKDSPPFLKIFFSRTPQRFFLRTKNPPPSPHSLGGRTLCSIKHTNEDSRATTMKLAPAFSWTLSWRRSVSYRNQSIDLLCKSMDWFLYHRDFLHERVNAFEKIFAHWVHWYLLILIHFRPMNPLYTSWNYSKTSGFLMFSVSVEKEHWPLE